MTRKPPTTNAVAAILRKAGYLRSEVTPGTRRMVHTAGYKVWAFPGEIRANWRPDTTRYPLAVRDGERDEAKRMLCAYALAVLEDGRYRAQVRGDIVSVTAKPEAED